jgi:hypothetical protein
MKIFEQRKLLVVVLMVLAAIIVYAVWYTIPKKIELKMEGIKYQLGEEHEDFVIPIRVHMKGKMKRSLMGAVSFKGTIDLEGEEIPVPVEHRELNLSLGKDQPGLVIYSYFDEGMPRLYSYGSMYTNRDFSKILFAVYNKNNSGSGGWSSEDGLMIAVPAKDRTEALDVSNELMEDYLKRGGAAPLK